MDDHPLVRAGVARVLEGRPGIRLVDEAADGPAALDKIARRRAEVLILDLTIPGVDGLEVLQAARRLDPALKVVVLTMHAGAEYVRRAMEAGADAYVLKESTAQDLLAAIERVVRGGTFLSPLAQEALERSQPGAASGERATDGLTAREREILRDIALGLSSKEIAGRLRISTRTVETHRANLMKKLGLRSVALLTQFAIRAGVVTTTRP